MARVLPMYKVLPHESWVKWKGHRGSPNYFCQLCHHPCVWFTPSPCVTLIVLLTPSSFPSLRSWNRIWTFHYLFQRDTANYVTEVSRKNKEETNNKKVEKKKVKETIEGNKGRENAHGQWRSIWRKRWCYLHFKSVCGLYKKQY